MTDIAHQEHPNQQFMAGVQAKAITTLGSGHFLLPVLDHPPIDNRFNVDILEGKCCILQRDTFKYATPVTKATP